MNTERHKRLITASVNQDEDNLEEPENKETEEPVAAENCQKNFLQIWEQWMKK